MGQRNTAHPESSLDGFTGDRFNAALFDENTAIRVQATSNDGLTISLSPTVA